MTVNIRKSCMCTAVEETDIEAILTQQSLRAGVFSLFPCPYPHRPL